MNNLCQVLQYAARFFMKVWDAVIGRVFCAVLKEPDLI